MIPGLKFGQDYYDDLLAKYTHKKELFLKGLDDLHIIHNDPEGAYYVLLDISEFGYDSDLKFCEDLARLVGVGAVPGSSFFREPVNHLIRFHFAKKDETLLNALNRLESLRSKTPLPQKELKGTALKREASQEQGLSVSRAARNPRCPRLQRYYPGVTFLPSMTMGATDAHHYEQICDTCLRCSPFMAEPQEAAAGVHGTNERIPVRAYLQGIRVLIDLMEHVNLSC